MRLGIMPKAQLISIHALREEGDAPLSMGPAKPMYFYPRPPRGGRPHDVSFVGQCDFISIHALREEGDLVIFFLFLLLPISIHALREEGDLGTIHAGIQCFDFYPRPPRGGRRGHGIDDLSGFLFLSTPSARRATRTCRATTAALS